jgi:hypothetical protein
MLIYKVCTILVPDERMWMIPRRPEEQVLNFLCRPADTVEAAG